MYSKEQIKIIISDLKLSIIGLIISYFLTLFGLLEAINYFILDSIKPKPLIFLSFGFVSLFFAIIKSMRKKSISFYVNNSQINIFFGDLFQQSGVIAIPVNNFIDTNLGVRISPLSLHGIFVENIANGAKYCDPVLKEIIRKDGNDLATIRKHGAKTGYTIAPEINDTTYLLTVLSKTDIKNNMASADLVDLITALSNLLNKAREITNDKSLNIPLFGAGLSKIDLPPQQLLEILLIMIKRTSQQQRITSKINIVLHPSVFSRISLKSILEGVKDGV